MKMSEFVCEVCGLGPVHGITVFRSAPKGGPAHPKCVRHLDAILDKMVSEIVAILEQPSQEKH